MACALSLSFFKKTNELKDGGMRGETEASS